MNFLKKNIIWIVLFCIGVFLIYKSIDYGESYFSNYIVHNNLYDTSQFEILLDKSILKYIVIGSLISILSIFKIKH